MREEGERAPQCQHMLIILQKATDCHGYRILKGGVAWKTIKHTHRRGGGVDTHSTGSEYKRLTIEYPREKDDLEVERLQ